MDPIAKGVFGAALNGHVGVTMSLLDHPDVAAAVARAQASGIPWGTIFLTILPFVVQIFSGQTIDWQGIIAAILALIAPPAARQPQRPN